MGSEPPQSLRIGAFVVGVFLIAVVIVVYATMAQKGAFPPGHPWSGISLALLGTQFLLWNLQVKFLNMTVVKLVIGILAVITGIMWVLNSHSS
jgi:hypothetical protein